MRQVAQLPCRLNSSRDRECRISNRPPQEHLQVGTTILLYARIVAVYGFSPASNVAISI
jgi:hypothetical protein